MPSAFAAELASLGPALLRAIDSFEKARRRLHPPALPRIREALEPIRGALHDTLETFRATPPDDGLHDFAHDLIAAAEHALAALDLFADDSSDPGGIARVLAAMREHALAQEALYPLRRALPAVSLFFLQPEQRERVAELDPVEPKTPRVGLMAGGGAPGTRGGFSLYVPESYDPSEALPLIVALHGGSGNGREFVWTWLREARSRRCILLAPTARGSTWSMMGPDVDHAALLSMVAYVREHWTVDAGRILLTGLSDGATYALLSGLREDVPFSALAAACGVFHPDNYANGNLERAAGKRIYLIHGALDWMFPVQIARTAAAALENAGADLTYREIEDLSHTYPREENVSILDWWLSNGV
jgi:phospholipase/carboxylesterase